MKNFLNTLSHREKMLIYILICFMIVILGWFFVVQPCLKNYSTAVSENATYQTQLSQVSSTLTLYQEAPGTLKIKQASYDEIVKKYNAVMKNEKIDKMITHQLLINSLNPSSLKMTDGDTTGTSNSTSSTTSTSSTSSSTSSTSSSSTSSNMKTVTVNVTVTGSINNVANLLSDVGSMKGVTITELSYTAGSTTAGTSTATTTTTSTASDDSFNITFVVYMIKK